MSLAKRVQRDLFEPVTARAPLLPTVQAKLAPLLKALLAEVCGQPSDAVASTDEREVGDEQDHG